MIFDGGPPKNAERNNCVVMKEVHYMDEEGT